MPDFTTQTKSSKSRRSPIKQKTSDYKYGFLAKLSNFGKKFIFKLTKHKIPLIIAFIIAIIPVLLFNYNDYLLKGAYHYKVTSDYQYDFNNKDQTTYQVFVNNGTIKINPQILKNSTAFLELKIKPVLMLFPKEPYILVKWNAGGFKQFIEYKGKGIRYVNISSIAENTKADMNEIVIKLKGNHVLIPDQNARIIAFNNPVIDNKTILVVAPHPDDAEIAAYSFYKNRNSYIVTVTLGERGHTIYTENQLSKSVQYYYKAKMRFWNSITTPLLGAIPPSHCVNLAYYDATIQNMFQDSTKTFSSYSFDMDNTLVFRNMNISPLSPITDGTAKWASLVRDFRFLIRKIQPDIIVTPHPQIDEHADHQFTTVALLQSLKLEPHKKATLFLYTNHLQLSSLYPFGFQGGDISLPPLNQTNLIYKSIYSFQVPFIDQQEKILVLDSHIDLRLNTEWLNTNGYLKKAIKRLIPDVKLSKSYYDRAIRENELFFVLPDTLADSLLKAYSK